MAKIPVGMSPGLNMYGIFSLLLIAVILRFLLVSLLVHLDTTHGVLCVLQQFAILAFLDVHFMLGMPFLEFFHCSSIIKQAQV